MIGDLGEPSRETGGGLLSLPWLIRFNLPNNLQMGASTLNWGDCASFGCICLPFAPHNFGTILCTDEAALQIQCKIVCQAALGLDFIPSWARRTTLFVRGDHTLGMSPR